MSDIAETIMKFAQKMVNRPLAVDSDLYNHGFDSLMMMELVVDIENQFGIELPPAALGRDRLRTIAQISQSVEAVL